MPLQGHLTAQQSRQQAPKRQRQSCSLTRSKGGDSTQLSWRDAEPACTDTLNTCSRTQALRTTLSTISQQIYRAVPWVSPAPCRRLASAAATTTLLCLSLRFVHVTPSPVFRHQQHGSTSSSTSTSPSYTDSGASEREGKSSDARDASDDLGAMPLVAPTVTLVALKHAAEHSCPRPKRRRCRRLARLVRRLGLAFVP